MGRRADHSRAELEQLILTEGHRLMAEAGHAGFSAREVAKRIGYSIGTIYHVFGSSERLLAAIDALTLAALAEAVHARLDTSEDRIVALVESHCDFASANPRLWLALAEHGCDAGVALARRLEAEIAARLPTEQALRAARLARSLAACVLGHCRFAIDGSFALLGEADPRGAALARVREALTAAGG